MRLVDTNVLLYATSRVPKESDKRSRAIELLEGQDLSLSVQVLQEFYHQATRSTRPGALTHDEALAFLTPFLNMPVQDVTPALFLEAVAISERFGLSYWDGAILAAARSLGCDAVYSEDLNPNQDYDGLRVINPFQTKSEVAS